MYACAHAENRSQSYKKDTNYVQKLDAILYMSQKNDKIVLFWCLF